MKHICLEQPSNIAVMWCSSVDLVLRMKVYSGVQERLDRDEKFTAFCSVWDHEGIW